MTEPGGKNPRIVERREPEPEPAWRARPLETLSETDRETLAKMREAFSKRGLDKEWVYEGAGLDVMPIFLAPDGVRHHFIDPMYHADAPLQGPLESSWLGREAGVAITPAKEKTVVSLEGGSSIEVNARSAKEGRGLPEQIDVLYNNTITRILSPAALDRLRPNGVIALEGVPRQLEGMVNHPTAVRPLSEMGVRPVGGTIHLENMNPDGVKPLMNYGLDKPKDFVIFEKTREFTNEERADIRVNTALEEAYYELRGPLYQDGFGANDREYLALKREDIREALNNFLGSLSDLPSQNQEAAKARLQAELAARVTNQEVADIFGWMLDVDQATGEHDFIRELQPERVPDFLVQLEKVAALVEIEAERVLGKATK